MATQIWIQMECTVSQPVALLQNQIAFVSLGWRATFC